MIKIYCVLYEDDVKMKLVELIHADKSFSFPHFVDTPMRNARHLIRFVLCTAEPISCKKPNNKCLDLVLGSSCHPEQVGAHAVCVSCPQVSADVLHSSLQLLQLSSDHRSGWSYQGKWWSLTLNTSVGARWKLFAESCFCCEQIYNECGGLWLPQGSVWSLCWTSVWVKLLT